MHEQHTPSGTLPRALHDALLRQLSVERTWLEAARESLAAVRRSAVLGDLEALDTALRDQAALTATRDDLATARRAVCGQVAAQLGLAENGATLGQIAARLSPAARRPVLAARRELAAGVRRVRALASGTVAIITHKRQIVDGVLGDWLGAVPTESRYTVDGRREDGLGRSLVECRT